MIENQKILICSDLDRTIIPNGYQAESDLARPVLRSLAQQPNIYLAYVSGRDRGLIREAIEDFHLPQPDYAIGDVGTTLYRIIDGNWHVSDDWSCEIGQDWQESDGNTLAALLGGIREIRLQEPEKQNQYKLSFYAAHDVDQQALKKNIQSRLTKQGVRAGVIWSIDETRNIGLLDVVPARASKLSAIRFLMAREQFSENRTVFAGDSGNDLDVLTSGLQAILVKNATEEVRGEALDTLSREGKADRLYLPAGNFYGMNGNYSAGVLEGLVHFIPETAEFLANAMAHLTQNHRGKVQI